MKLEEAIKNYGLSEEEADKAKRGYEGYILYSQTQAQLDYALLLGQITSEEYWEEFRRLSTDLD